MVQKVTTEEEFPRTRSSQSKCGMHPNGKNC